MLFPILLIQTADALRARAPDLPGCEVVGQAQEDVLPRLRLAIEGRLTALLLAGSALPDTRGGLPPAASHGSARSRPGERWLSIHVNLAHLAALARHQRHT